MVDPITLALLLGAATALALLLPLGQTVCHALRQWSYLRHLPSPPAAHWLLGQVPVFLSTSAPMRLAEWAKQYGGAYRVRFFHAWGVVITEPHLVRAVLQSSKTYVPKERALLRSLELPCGGTPNILTSSDGDYWRLVRGAWMKCFTSTNLKKILPILQDICDRVTEQIKQKAETTAAAATAGSTAAAEEQSDTADTTAVAAGSSTAATAPAGAAAVNICNITDRITLDVIGHMSYGRDFGAVDHKRSRYLELVSALLALTHEETDHPLRRLMRKLKGENRRKALLAAEWDATNTAEVMRALADPPGEHTIAGLLLALRDPVTQQPLTLQQLKSELVIATLAGFETTSNALSWTIGALAAHPHAMQALEQELASAGLLATPDSPNPARFEWQTLGKLSYLQACIREGLRLFSPAANGSWRMSVHSDIQISKDLTLPKGTPIGIPFFAFGHYPGTYGPDAEAFRPERWLASRATGLNPSPNSSTDEAADSKVTAPTASEDAADNAASTPSMQRSSSSKPLQDPWTFSIGPRDCAGQALAHLELQVVTAAVVGNFRVQLAPEVGGWEGLLRRRMFHTTLQVEGGLPLLLTPRVAVGKS